MTEKMAKILKGKDVADSLSQDIAKKVEELKGKGIIPTLGILRVGEREEDLAYERGAVARAGRLGVDIVKYQLQEDISESELMKTIEEINGNDNIHGLLLLKPLPGHIDESRICSALSPEKDVDGITPASMAGIYSGETAAYPPCTAQACIEILKYYGIEFSGARAVVLGRSLVIGKPVTMLLLKENATVTVCHSKTTNLAEICREADIIIACAGKSKMLTEEYMRAGQIIIDVGINVDEGGNMTGDADFEKACGIVEGITPVPGGVGSVTTTVLMSHVVSAAAKKG